LGFRLAWIIDWARRALIFKTAEAQVFIPVCGSPRRVRGYGDESKSKKEIRAEGAARQEFSGTQAQRVCAHAYRCEQAEKPHPSRESPTRSQARTDEGQGHRQKRKTRNEKQVQRRGHEALGAQTHAAQTLNSGIKNFETLSFSESTGKGAGAAFSLRPYFHASSG